MTGDPEILAMSQITQALSELDDSARVRVLRWAVDRYAASSTMPLAAGEALQDQGAAPDGTEFSDLSELYNAARPSTESERALVASYWFQEELDQPEIDALTVNRALKGLGYRIGNITRAFDRLQGQDPVLAMQVKKKGSTKQARKRYKVTRAGIQRVNDMIAGTAE